uniref:C2H2-type domain-containing protein n=1 Tax=Romanomermis culicivorax TaxID=13658 RepID=A0A915L4P8_ROMCU
MVQENPAIVLASAILSCNIDHCKKLFETKKKLCDHQYNVHKSKNFYHCSKCPSSFPTPSKLSRHGRVHNTFKCTIDGCESQLTSFQEKRKHDAKCHPKTTCTTCNKSFSSRACLKKHERLIHRKMIKCTQENCSSMVLPRHLAKHMKESHSDVLLSDLRKKKIWEENEHSELDHYFCPHCEEKFAKFQSLKRHVARKHEGETEKRAKKFTCNFSNDCERRFVSLDKLESHLNWHKNYKPYVCPENERCMGSFCGRSSLQRHLKNVHLKTLSAYTPKQLGVDFELDKEDDESEIE